MSAHGGVGSKRASAGADGAGEEISTGVSPARKEARPSPTPPRKTAPPPYLRGMSVGEFFGPSLAARAAAAPPQGAGASSAAAVVTPLPLPPPLPTNTSLPAPPLTGPADMSLGGDSADAGSDGEGGAVTPLLDLSLASPSSSPPSPSVVVRYSTSLLLPWLPFSSRVADGPEFSAVCVI
jgi:hypothetical protein